MAQAELDPSHIMQVGMGFWPSKTVLSAVELELFTHLGSEGMTGTEVGERLGLHPRGIYDFLDTLVALRFLERDGGILEMSNARLYHFWGDLTDALRTGSPQNEIKQTGKPMFEELYSDPARLEQFMGAMQGISLGNFHALAEKFELLQVRDRLRCGGRHRPAQHDPGESPSQPSLHQLRPAGGGPDRGEDHRRCRDV